jgi:hypothetical protein
MPHWQPAALSLDLFFRIERTFAGCIRPTGLNYVDANVVANQFGGPRSRHVVHGGLCAVVRSVVREWLDRMHGTDHHNRAALLVRHLAGRELAAVKYAP